MRKLSIDEIKEIQLDILDYVDKICKENDIQYSLAYGTLLGAVRHKGYIPWDDDIDIMLMRSEYEKLISILIQDNGEYEIFTMDRKDYYFTYAKLSCKRTSIIEKNWRVVKNMGVNIDIFPMDYLSEVDNKCASRAIKLQRNIQFCMTDIWCCHSNKIISLIKRILRCPKVAYLRIKGSEYYKNECKKIVQNCKESPYVDYLFNAPTAKIPSDVFDDYQDLEFEGRMYKAINKENVFLETVYGDYMVLPDESKRISNHDFVAYEN